VGTTSAKKSKKKIASIPASGIPDNFELTPELSRAFDLMENSGEHLYITGKAGTGKSTLLQYFKQQTGKKVVTLAPTGLAAINVGGATIHSFFHFPHHLITKDKIHRLRGQQALFDALETVIIDEVSMVRADVMDGIDHSLRINRGRLNIPFGGVQVILIGDLCQLPPIVERELAGYFKDTYSGPFFFSADIIKEINPEVIELQKVFRQNDPEFVDLLNKIRHKRINPSDLRKLNERHGKYPVSDRSRLAITLTSTNAQASEINLSHLDSLDNHEYVFDAIVQDDFDEKSYPADKQLCLKRGAQVMMVKNDPNKRWVNGTLGVIRRVSDDLVEVSFPGGAAAAVEPLTWEKIGYQYDKENGRIEPVVTGSFTQYPIKLAWAITIHKSQGKTFDEVIIDFGNGAFAHGQAYVALSRCRSFEGIHLKTPIRHSDIILDSRVGALLR
jgi:ATP-dependent exoDNAse (exonuclease V) alpha subunit